MTKSTGTERKPARAEAAARWRAGLFNLMLFCGAGVYTEVCLHLCVFRGVELHIVYPILFGLMTGAVMTLLVSSLPRTPQRIAGVILVLAQSLLAEIQLIYHAIFGSLMALNQVQMGGGVLTNFLGQTLYAIGKNIGQVLLLLVPVAAVILVLVLKKGLSLRTGWQQALALVGITGVLFGFTVGLMHLACRHTVPVWRVFRNVETSTDQSYREVGMTATTLQELRYMLFGSRGDKDTLVFSGNGQSQYDPAEYNVMPELDLKTLAESTEDQALAELDQFFAAREPSRKNEFTGRMKDYNVVLLCAESYAPWFVSQELTPTLYEMSHSGIVFENYYGTFAAVTTNGEYTTCLGLYPDMTRTKTESSFDLTVGHYLPFCLGTALKDCGYTTWAYHNYLGEFYNRTQTHPNMGYRFRTPSNGLDITLQWPSSDLEMMEASVDDYLYSDQPFHAYYMTFSGHYQYNWDNVMCAKHRAEVQDLPYSEEVKAYIACNLEVEYALSYLVDRLEEAGKLDSTVIVLTNDHYPYGLSEDQYNELAGQKIDTTYEKYRNHFICYAPGLEETVRVKDYCSTADILPTLLNLLGVEYDSRLLAGTDVLSDSPHMAVLYDGRFLTEQFRYDETTGTLTVTDPTAQIGDELLQTFRTEVANRFTFSREILNTDYYAHVFGHVKRIGTPEPEALFDDEENVFHQADILFIYRRGLMDLAAPGKFAPKEEARIGDYVTAVYRYLGSPGASRSSLPEDYLAGASAREMAAFHSSPQFDAVCWAFETGLLRPEDRENRWDASIDDVEICLLMYRTAQSLGWDTSVDDTLLRQFFPYGSTMNDEEMRAAFWCLNRGMIFGTSGTEFLFRASDNSRVTRYRLTVFLTRVLYPDM